MNQIIKKLKEKRGSGYIDMVIIVILISICLMLVIKLMPVFIMKHKMDTFANGVSRILSVEGNYDTYTIGKIQEYGQDMDMENANLNLEGTDFLPGTTRIQLSTQIVVNVQGTYDMSFWEFTRIPIALNSKAISQSEVYWK